MLYFAYAKHNILILKVFSYCQDGSSGPESRVIMSPFSQLLYDIRVRHGLRQADLAERIGYEQSYISALEVGLKGPPNDEFLDRLTTALSLSEIERGELRVAANASQRKLVIDADASPEVFWLLTALREGIDRFSPAKMRAIQAVVSMPDVVDSAQQPMMRRVRRRLKEEAPM